MRDRLGKGFVRKIASKSHGRVNEPLGSVANVPARQACHPILTEAEEDGVDGHIVHIKEEHADCVGEDHRDLEEIRTLSKDHSPKPSFLPPPEVEILRFLRDRLPPKLRRLPSIGECHRGLEEIITPSKNHCSKTRPFLR